MIRPPQDESEQRIAELLSRNDPHALSLLYDKYSAAIFGVIIRITGNQHLAETCLVNSFNEIWQQRAAYSQTGERLFSWVIKIARSAAKKVTDHDLKEEIDLLFGTGKAQKLVDKYVLDGHGSLNELSGDDHKLLELIYVKDIPVTQAAEVLSKPVSQIKPMLIKAIKQLKSSGQ